MDLDLNPATSDFRIQILSMLNSSDLVGWDTESGMSPAVPCSTWAPEGWRLGIQPKEKVAKCLKAGVLRGTDGLPYRPTTPAAPESQRCTPALLPALLFFLRTVLVCSHPGVLAIAARAPSVLPMLLAPFCSKASGASKCVGHCVPEDLQVGPPQNPMCHARGLGARGPVQLPLLSISFPLSQRATQGSCLSVVPRFLSTSLPSFLCAGWKQITN